MTNALVRQEIPDEQVGLIKRMIAKDATNDELQLFLHQCQRTGLDPFSKQIYAISRFSKTDNRKVMAIQVSIDGARLIAERTGKYDNQEGPYWCGEDGEWKDVWLSKAPPRAAKVLVYKVGSSRATTGIAHWDEYHDSKSSFWTNKPALMLAKCAEMLALRKAFPQELSGLYAQEEMGSADEVIDVTPQVRPESRNGGSVTDSTQDAPKTSQQPTTPATGDADDTGENNGPTDDELEVLGLWRSPDDAKRWAVEVGACANEHHARESFKKIVDASGGKLNKENIAVVYLAFLRHSLAKQGAKVAA